MLKLKLKLKLRLPFSPLVLHHPPLKYMFVCSVFVGIGSNWCRRAAGTAGRRCWK